MIGVGGNGGEMQRHGGPPAAMGGSGSASNMALNPSYHQMQKELDGAAGYLKRDINPNPTWNAKYRPVQDSD